MSGLAAIARCETVIEIGGLSILVRTESPEFLRMLESRYAGFINNSSIPVFEFVVKIVPPGKITEQEDLVVRFESGQWIIERGDFRAEWSPASGRGHIVQSSNPYSIDSAMRIILSLLLAREGGLLVHAASAVRNGKAFLFAGVSGAGKTTISRLRPTDVTLLTDEISYLRRDDQGFIACGTPFAGELAKVGENVQSRLAALYLLQQGPENAIERVGVSDAVRSLLRNVLFFAHDSEIVSRVFESACELALRVPVYRLTFVPDARVWELVA